MSKKHPYWGRRPWDWRCWLFGVAWDAHGNISIDLGPVGVHRESGNA